MNINTTDILAAVGSLAWVPQVGYFFFSKFSKPKLIILPGNAIELGFTALGPIINIRLSISTKVKDAVLDFVGLEVCRKADGAKHFFDWVGMREIFSEIKGNDGYSQNIQREFLPIAIKTNVLSLVERDFRFQDSIFLEESQKEFGKLSEHFEFTKEKDDPINHIVNGKQFDDYIKFCEECFCWKAGDYIVTFLVRSPEKIIFRSESFIFKLDQNQIRLLEKNKEHIKIYIKNMFENILCPEDKPPIKWNWSYPSLRKLDSKMK